MEGFLLRFTMYILRDKLLSNDLNDCITTSTCVQVGVMDTSLLIANATTERKRRALILDARGMNPYVC
jgi:hypothetical protein